MAFCSLLFFFAPVGAGNHRLKAAEDFPRCARGMLFCSPLFFFSLRKKKAFFARCAGGSANAPPSSFSPAEKKKSAVHGVEEKEGFAHSVCIAPPTGAERLFVKYSFSCGLRPKAAATEKSRSSIVRHLSGQNLCVFARAMLSASKAALSAKVYNSFKFLLWHVFRMRLFSLSAATP